MADTVRYVADPPRAAELVIIGGGIVGAATAFHASRAGRVRCCWSAAQRCAR